MSFWKAVGEFVEAAAEASNPTNHYQSGYRDAQNNYQRKQYSIWDRTSHHARIAIDMERAYNQGYDDAIREKMMSSFR